MIKLSSPPEWGQETKSLQHRVFPTLPEDFTGEEEDKPEKDCIQKIIDFKKWKEAE